MPEVGQVVSDLQTIAYDARLEIRPPSGQNWFISSVYHSKEAALYKVEGGLEVLFATDDDAFGGAWSGFKWFVTNDSYLIVENINPNEDDQELGYEGVRIA